MDDSSTRSRIILVDATPSFVLLDRHLRQDLTALTSAQLVTLAKRLVT